MMADRDAPSARTRAAATGVAAAEKACEELPDCPVN